ncbi:MAG: Holliday junction resolvase RuvX [Deltaproteobacteria bacterium]|nr:Holliday junction resolvase RuvX [Deltaproteobacteria bacterium]MBM4317497.1 Holliday junction resolvase RuvX [Deltaproteobacteria bacterium]
MFEDSKRILGLDIGTKRTGIAIADETLSLASPLHCIEANSHQDWLTKLLKVLENYSIEKLIVGIPLNQHGEEGKDAQRIKKYIALLREQLKFPVIEWDERFTTVQAERALLSTDMSRKNRKQVIDQIAATMMLQSYLDYMRFQKELPTL